MPKKRGKKRAGRRERKQGKTKKASPEKMIAGNGSHAISKNEPKKFSREDRQAITVLAFMIIAVAAFLLFYFMFRNAGVFVYEGIRFQKTDSNGLTLYHGKIGMKTAQGAFNYNLYLRNDPRNLAGIQADISAVLRRTGYISFEPRISSCYGSSLAAYNLASFLSAFGMQVKGATTSHQVAIDESIAEKTCADALNQTIIVLQHANQTNIQQKGDCYTINIANCDAIGASEAFMLAILKDLWSINAG